MKRFRQLVLVLLVFAQIAGAIAIPLPVQVADQNLFAADLPPDLLNHWASGVVSYWMDQAVLAGFPDGTARPDAALERSQMITFINRAMGYTSSGNYQFGDIASDDWHAQEFLIARQAGYFTGFTGNMAYPDQIVNRAEAATLLCRVFNLTPKTPFDDLSRFSDYETALVSSPARSSLEAMVERDFLAGYQDNTLRPDEALTRATLMSMFSKIMQLYLNQAGVNHSGNDITMEGNVVVRQSPATLSHITINGDLVIAPGSGDGTVTLDNVQVNGRILVMGGGDVQILNSKTNEMMISKIGGRRPVVTIENCEFERLLVHCPSDIDVDEDSVLRSLVVYPEANDAKVFIGADLRTVELFSPTAQVTLSSERGSSSGGDDDNTGNTGEETDKPGPNPADNIEVFDPSVPQVWMPTRQYIMTIGSQIYIEAKVYPIGADPALDWATSKKDVVSVNEYGFVSALKEGVSTVTATSKERPELSATAEIIVEFRNPINIELNNKSLTLAIKKSARLTATIFPITGVKQDIQWMSGDESIATVDKNGTVRGVKIGKTFVAAYVAEAPAIQARCNISITSSGTLIEKLTLSRDVDVMTVGEKKVYVVEAITPTKATLKETNWWSSDTSVAMVYNAYNSKTKMTEAEVHALYPGEFMLYCESVDGSDVTASMRITVEPRMADDYELIIPEYNLEVGDRVTWGVEFIPNHAANQLVYWESSNPEYVSVDQNGTLWAHKTTISSGVSVQVVAYAAYYPNLGPKSHSVTVRGRDVDSLDFSYRDEPGYSTTSIRIPAASSREIDILVRPKEAAEKKLSFESLDEDVFTVSATGDTTALVRGLQAGVGRLRVTHDTSGVARDFWIVVASRDFEQFLDRLRSSTNRFSSTKQPESFFYYNPDLEYETASFFYSFQKSGGVLPDAAHENVFYGLVNAWSNGFKDQQSERLPGGVGRMPREAQAMSLLLKDPSQIRLSLSTASNDELTVISNTVRNLWVVSEANFDWGDRDYFAKLCQYLFFESGSNTLPPAKSSVVSHILNLNHLLARTVVNPYGAYDNQITNVKHVSNFINDYMETFGSAAVVSITKLNDTAVMRAEYARRMVFDTLMYYSSETSNDKIAMPKQTELDLLGIGFLYNDLDPLSEMKKFNDYLIGIISNAGVYFPKLNEYLAVSDFNPDYYLAYRSYSMLFPEKTPAEVIDAINKSTYDYRQLLMDLDGRYAIYCGSTRITELMLPFDTVRNTNDTSWKPTRVALFRRDNKPPLYMQLPYISFRWKETGNYPPEDYGEFVFQVLVSPQGFDTVAILDLPVYVHGNDLLNRRNTIKERLAASQPLTYNDLVAARVDPGKEIIEEYPDKDIFMLKGVMTDTEITEGWLQYFEWFYGQNKVNAIIDSLEYPEDIDEFWSALRHTANDLRTRDTIIQDYKLFKFFEIYLKRWLDISIIDSNRKLSNDFLWHPGDFLELGNMDQRDYIVSLSKMESRPGDSYQFATRSDGFRSKWPLESHRTGLFFSDTYAFSQINNVKNVGNMIERYVALCNESALSDDAMTMASNWSHALLKQSTHLTVYSYRDASNDSLSSLSYSPSGAEIQQSFWKYLRTIDDELLPLLTLPAHPDPDVRLVVMPGIVLISSTSSYGNDRGDSKNDNLIKALGVPLLNIVFNLEKKHDYMDAKGTWLREKFEASWSENGPLIVFDLDRGKQTSLTTRFYDPLRYWGDEFSSTQLNRVALGDTVFIDTKTSETKGWKDELQYLLLEGLSLHNAFGYNNPDRLLPQEMGGMMLSHDGIDWKLTSDDVDDVPSHTDMQEPLKHLWETRTVFDLWWSDLYLESQNTMGYQSYRYHNRAERGYPFFDFAGNANLSGYVYSNPPSYTSPNAALDSVYLLNGQYRLLSDPSRSEYMVDHRYPNFKLLNPPGNIFFSISLSGSGDQGYEGLTLTPKRDDRYVGRYDLPRVSLMEQLFYRHGWKGVMSYLSANVETASLDKVNDMIYAEYKAQGISVSEKTYGSWTDWTLQEWDRYKTLGNQDAAMGQTVAGLTYWEWQKLIQVMVRNDESATAGDPGYLKEFFVEYIGKLTADFADPLPDSVPGIRSSTLTAIDVAYRKTDGKITNSVYTPLFPAPKDVYTYVYNLPTQFPALWLLNTTARTGDHVYRTAADNLKLILYGNPATQGNLLTESAIEDDKNDYIVEAIIESWDTPTHSVYLNTMNEEPLNLAWAYGNEAILWRAYSEVKETDPHMLNLLMHPTIPESEKNIILDVYSTPELKSDRDAYLYRRTNPNYNAKYETAYFNYSYLYGKQGTKSVTQYGYYDTKSAQDDVVANVNALGTRYMQDLALLLNKKIFPLEWRDDLIMVRFLSSFLEHDNSYLTQSELNNGIGYQTDPEIIELIYAEFGAEASFDVFVNGSGRRESRSFFNYQWEDTSTNPSTTVTTQIKLDFHDLYHRIEISRLPNRDENDQPSMVLNGYKNRALYEYLDKNGTYSFVMKNGLTDYHRIVTLSLGTPSNSQVRENASLEPDTKRLGITDQVYYRSGSSLYLNNSLSFGATSRYANSFKFKERGSTASQDAVDFYPILLFTKQSIDNNINYQDWTISVAELSNNTNLNASLPRPVHFLTDNASSIGSRYHTTDYVTNLIALNSDPQYNDKNFFYIPELLVTAAFEKQLRGEDRFHEIQGIFSDSGNPTPLEKLKQLEQLVLLGYSMEEIRHIANTPQSILEILDSKMYMIR